MNVLIGNAWPYTNGPLHVGRIASLLPGDILARYHRLMGDNVVFISGSDCHGTPVTRRALEEGLPPFEVVNKYHNKLKNTFEKFNFSYDYFAKTHSDYHMNIVSKIILDLLNKGYIYEKEINQVICSGSMEIILDNYIDERCRHCEKSMEGTCNKCGNLYEAHENICEKCKHCTGSLQIVKTNQLFFALSKFENDVKRLLIRQKDWRNNAINITKRYLDEGLKDKILTRNSTFGIDVPLNGYDDKKIYVWIEAVMGYLTASMEYLSLKGEDYLDYFQGDESKIYLVHEKENVPFHTVVLPGILAGIGIKNPNIQIISSEKLRLEGKQFSIAKGHVIWGDYIANNYCIDSIRYYLTVNGAEESSTDFKWRDFINENNNILVKIVGNYINRVFSCIVNNYQGKISKFKVNNELKNKILNIYFIVGDKIEEGKFKEALQIIITSIKVQNSKFNTGKEELYESVQFIANLSNLLDPFMPDMAEKLRNSLGIKRALWRFIEVEDIRVKNIGLLFHVIEKDKIYYEINNLKKLGR